MENKERKTDAEIKEERFRNGVKKWASYWRANPHRFAIEYLEIFPFALFQKILIFMMFRFNYFLFFASRGLGKTYITALYCVIRCILYPGTWVCIAAAQRSQSINIISEKIQAFYDKYPKVASEIETIKVTNQDSVVKFKNKSWIKVVTARDSARSARANVLISDEFRLMDYGVIQRVLRKFLTSRRQPGFLKHEKYKGMQEPNTEIYLSSIGTKDEWSFEKFLSYKNLMLAGKKYFTCGLPYQLGIKEGILDKQRIIDEMEEDDVDWIAFQMEYGCVPLGDNEKSHFKYAEMNKCRDILKPILPMTTDEFIKNKGDKKKNNFFVPKKANEIRILSMDIAAMQGKDNDNTSFTLLRLIPNGNEYIKMSPYMEILHGENTMLQALRLKQIFYDLDCDYCVMDTAGVGLGVFDECTRIIIDAERGTEYPAWTSMNDEKMQERAIDKTAIPIIFSIKIAGAGATETMHQIYTYAKTQFEKKKIKLLVSEIKAKEYLAENHDFVKLSPQEQATLIAPYANASRMIGESVNLEKTYVGGFIKLIEPRGKRKDRTMSLLYALHYARILENELRKDSDVKDYSKIFKHTSKTNENRTHGFGSRNHGFGKGSRKLFQ